MTHAHKIFIRTKKEDSAFVYHILEAQDGLAAYSTIDFEPHDPFRDLELLVPEELVLQLEALLDSFGDMVIRLPDDPSKK